MGGTQSTPDADVTVSTEAEATPAVAAGIAVQEDTEKAAAAQKAGVEIAPSEVAVTENDAGKQAPAKLATVEKAAEEKTVAADAAAESPAIDEAPVQQPAAEEVESEVDTLASDKAAGEKAVAANAAAEKSVIDEAPVQQPAAEEVVNEVATLAADQVGSVTVQNMAGNELATVSPVPPNIFELKKHIEKQKSIAVALQRLIECESCHIYDNSEILDGKSLNVIMVVDETSLFAWDVTNNPGKDMLKLEGTAEGANVGAVLTCPEIRSDYVNVLTQEPMRNGSHYFEFVMHYIGDEQWCGVVTDPSQAGTRCGGRSLKGWTYYCGRMQSGSESIVDGKGCLHAEGKAVKEFKKLKPEGDVIGMLVDLDTGAIAFDLNGELQGACSIPKATPLWVITHVDTRKDKVELRKPCLMDAPPANLDALKGALLDISSGQDLR